MYANIISRMKYTASNWVVTGQEIVVTRYTITSYASTQAFRCLS